MNANISESVFIGGGEMGAMMRSHDWSQTPLGAVETWPQSLRSALSICLNSRFPIAIYWGQDSILLYNDAWRPILGDKHSWALGHPAREVWSEIWDTIGPELASVLTTGEGIFHKDELLSMQRFGYTEECFFEYTFNPIQGEGGVVDGVFNIVTETTYRVLNDRRARLLREVASKTGIAKTAADACALMLETFKTDPLDIPFALLYLLDSDDKQARLCHDNEFTADPTISPAVIDLAAADDPKGWPIALAARTAQPQAINDLVSRFGVLPGSPWAEPPQEAMVLPISAPGYSKVSGVLVAVASPRRKLDDNYRDFFTQLAGQVAIAIANAQSYEAERQRAEVLAELDRAKTTFFSNVSHEFRTPLTLMLSPLEDVLSWLEEDAEAEERESGGGLSSVSFLKEQLQLVQRNGLRLQKLVNTLLDFSRIEAGRVQASYEPIDLAGFTAELASTFRSLIERAGIELIIDCPALPEPVYVDREMWEKIVFNLLSNAFKFTFTGSITVQLHLAGDTAQLKVKDTGVGIPATELPRLFERFHRVSGTRSRTYEGSGIGLSLVQELVKLHQGTIEVTSVEGEGTCFTVAIPTGTAHLPSDRIRAPRTLASTALTATVYLEEAQRWLSTDEVTNEAEGSINRDNIAELSHSLSVSSTPKFIVLADDNADMRDYVKRLLSQQYQVEAVPDGLAALLRIRQAVEQQQVPDLVLTDVMMPNLDGFGLLQALRSDPQTREVPIIMLSARAGEEARIEGLEAGADDYLTKPFSARELLARVEATLKLAQLRREATQREQSLRQAAESARQQVETILSSIRDGFYVLDRDWCFTYVNDRYCEMIGMLKADILEQNIWQLFPATVDTEVYVQFYRAIQEQIPLQFEYFYAPWDCWHDYRIYPSPTGLTVFLADITDRKQAELDEQFLNQLDQQLRQLSTAEAMVKAALSSLGEYLQVDRCIWDRIDWLADIAIVEQEWCKQADMPSLVGTYQISNLILPELANLFRAGQPAIAADVTTYPYTAPFADNILALGIHAFVAVPCVYDGRWVATLAAQSKIPRNWQPNEVALLQEFVARLWSLIEHIRAVEELHQREAELRHLANAMPQVVWIAKADGTLEFINDRWTEYTGLNLEQSRNRDLIEQVIPPEDNQQLYADFTQAQATRSSYQSQFRIRQPDGSYLYFLARATPILDEQGHVRKWYGTSTDITELKQLEAERSRLLAQEQAAREAAESANRVKDEFLAVLSHELRSPLNPILGWSKLLQTGKLDAARTKQALTTIERNAKLQSELIEDLLDVSRILRGKLSLSISPVNLTSTIQAAIETVRLAAEAKSIQIEADLNSEVVLVAGDPTRIQQIIWNLLSNAVKFTPNGGTVELRLEQSNHYAQIQVKDTGKGISADFLPYVFEYFRQADSATTRKFGGLGLGLAIARHLVELHGGTIQADSPGEGLGATFTVRLPLMSPQSMANQSLPLSDPALNLQGVQVLVVDDESDTRDFIEFLLQQTGATVLTAASAAEALTTVMRTKPDVLLSDIGMPDMDGYMLLQQIRTLPAEQGGTIPAIALTAYAGDFNQQLALEAGFQRHIAKPIEPQVLIQTIAEVRNIKK